MENTNSLYNVLIQECLIDDFSHITKSEWDLFFCMENKNYISEITESILHIKPIWKKSFSYKNNSHEISLNFPISYKKYIDNQIYEIHEDIEKRKSVIRIPEYLLKNNFKLYNTEHSFGEESSHNLKMITNVFGDFVHHNDGVMSYIKINDMCIYLHKYIKIEKNEIRYIHKYVFESFDRFSANEMLIYRVDNKESLSKQLDDYLTTHYTSELFCKSFFELTEDELILLKMEII